MGKLNGKMGIIALDLDGTLLTNDKKITQKTIDVLEHAHNDGVIITVVTGRALGACPEQVRNASFIDYIIQGNGSAIYRLKDMAVIRRRGIPHAQVMKIVHKMMEQDTLMECYYDGNAILQEGAVDKFSSLYYCPLDIRNYLNATRKTVPDFYKFISGCKEGVDMIDCFYHNMDERADMFDFISKETNLFATTAYDNNIEIVNREASKGEGLIALSKLTGVPVDRIVAFGDSRNDLSITEIGCSFVAMGNGYDFVRKAADYVTLTNEEDGVAYMVSRLMGYDYE